MSGYDPIPMLENAGYTEQEAAFLYLVAVHSGYFLRRQFSRFVQRDRGGLADRFIHKGLRLDQLRVIECGQARHVYHLTSRPVYQTILRGDSQHRRFKGFGYMQSRLLILDFVLDNLNDTILEDEAAKVGFFTARCGVRSELLPRGWAGRAVFFPDGYPIFVSSDGAPRFTFFEDGSVTLTRFERHLDQYRPLFSALRAFELVYVSDVEKSFPFARASFAAHFTETQVAGVSEQTPLGVEHFLEYLRVREMQETRSWPVTGRDLGVLEEGEPIYTSLEHHALYAAWKMQSTDAEKIRKRFMQQGPQAKFTTIALPYTYPLFSLKRERKPARITGHGCGQASGHCWRRLSHADTTSYADRWGQGRVCAGGGSDPPLRVFRVGSAALVAPTPGIPGIQKISDADISRICAGYKPDQFGILR